MAVFMTPPLDEVPWPTLGPEICDWLEATRVYGPGPLLGQPYVVDAEFRARIYRAYEVFPRGHPRAGRRRFKRVVWIKRKGLAKTEDAALIMSAELAHDAPVRCDGWRRQGSVWVPVGRPVAAPYIPMMATSLEQAEDLAYTVMRQILLHSPDGHRFDIGLERIIRLDDHGREDGKAEAVSTSPSGNDGALTSAQHFDESHRLKLPRHRNAHKVMLENTFKRQDADAWTLETSTPGDPTEHSVARDSKELAEAIAAGKVPDPAMLYIHRHAPLDMPLKTPAQVKRALVEATGPQAWSADLDALVSRYFEPTTDKQYWCRVWLAQWRVAQDRAFDPDVWAKRRHPAGQVDIDDGAFVTLGFDGARRHDSTALVATEIETGHQHVVGFWERPTELDPDEEWEIDAGDVDETMRAAFARWSVWRLYADPPYWDDWVNTWSGRWGEERVVAWWTARRRPTAHMMRRFRDAQRGGLTHDGHGDYATHVGNAFKVVLQGTMEDGEPLWLIRKERPDSPNKIDLVMAGALSWEARGDAIAAGAKPAAKRSKTLRRF